MNNQQTLNLPLDKTTQITCDSCENNAFIPGFMLRKASKFITGTSNDAVIPIQTMLCSSCGHINKDLIPLELRQEYTEFEEIENNNEKTLPHNVKSMNNVNK